MSVSKPQQNLAAILTGIQYRLLGVNPAESLDSLQVTTITCDSRMVEAGAMFVALRGVNVDGHDFIEGAVASGCKFVLCEEGKVDLLRIGKLVCIFVVVEDSGRAYAEISANFYNQPAKRLKCVGVTGTNGKTTVTYLVEQVLVAAGKSVGVIGTVNNRYTLVNGKQKILPTRFTTPEAFLLQQVLWEMAESGVEYLVMEVSSHALKQARVGTMQFDVAAFTNLSRDHLDYHPDMEDYFESKALLFSEYLKKGGTGVLPSGTVGLDQQHIERLQGLVVDRGARPVFWGRSG
jgi:murE/murF fusion protein